MVHKAINTKIKTEHKSGKSYGGPVMNAMGTVIGT